MLHTSCHQHQNVARRTGPRRATNKLQGYKPCTLTTQPKEKSHWPSCQGARSNRGTVTRPAVDALLIIATFLPQLLTEFPIQICMYVWQLTVLSLCHPKAEFSLAEWLSCMTCYPGSLGFEAYLGLERFASLYVSIRFIKLRSH